MTNAKANANAKTKLGEGSTPGPMTKFTVHRSRWLRGEGMTNSYLLRPTDNKMCCLGFAAISCGHSEQEITHACTPEDLEHPLGFMARLFEEQSITLTNVLCDKIMRINDDPFLFDSMREAALKELFATIDVEIVFKY